MWIQCLDFQHHWLLWKLPCKFLFGIMKFHWNLFWLSHRKVHMSSISHLSLRRLKIHGFTSDHGDSPEALPSSLVRLKITSGDLNIALPSSIQELHVCDLNWSIDLPYGLTRLTIEEPSIAFHKIVHLIPSSIKQLHWDRWSRTVIPYVHSFQYPSSNIAYFIDHVLTYFRNWSYTEEHIVAFMSFSNRTTSLEDLIVHGRTYPTNKWSHGVDFSFCHSTIHFMNS